MQKIKVAVFILNSTVLISNLITTCEYEYWILWAFRWKRYKKI